MRALGFLTVMAALLQSPVQAAAQDASQVKRELYGKLAHLRAYQDYLTNISTALLERTGSLQRASKMAQKEYAYLKPIADKQMAQVGKLDKAISEFNARCAGVPESSAKYAGCINKRNDLAAWKSAVDKRSNELAAKVEANGDEMISIAAKMMEVHGQMEKKTAELNSVKSDIRSVLQAIDKIRIDERQANNPSSSAVHAKHPSDCPTWSAPPPSLPVESAPGTRAPRWAEKRIFAHDCIVTKPNGQTTSYKEGDEQTPTMRLKGGPWDGSNEAEDDEVSIGGKG